MLKSMLRSKIEHRRFKSAILGAVIPVHQFMQQALATVLRKAPDSPDKIAFAWRAAVGAAVANVTAVELRGHVLRVQTRDAAWRREIERSAGIIRSRVNTLLSTTVVKTLDVRLE